MTDEKSKEWQMELLMEKIRAKAPQFKPLGESAKALRMSLLEKRYPIDNVERNQLQKCLDILHNRLKVNSLQGMVERLESVTRQLGLKFMVGPSGNELFISSDMFYLEVVLQPNGKIEDVKIHHEAKVEQQSCKELVACLSRGDFSDFTAQLEGLIAIYQLNADKKAKCKAFSTLQSLETDLSMLAQIQKFIKEPFNLIHKSPVGVLQPRKGGHPMKLTYLVAPYELLIPSIKYSRPLNVEEVLRKDLGYSVSVCLEGSTSHKLPIQPLISISLTQSGKSTPSYATLNSNNSTMLPAWLMLKLSKPLPMCISLVRKIQQLTELEWPETVTPQPLLSLITSQASNGTMENGNNRGLFVNLPEHHHCYFLTETRGHDGILVNNIPFTHPIHVPQILVCLRQQALFNVLISSCIRPNARQDIENMIMFEITALSWQNLSISFVHPHEETMTTVDLDLTDIANIKCDIYGANSWDKINKIINRSLSIPVTLRSLILHWERQSSHRSSLNGTGLGLGGVAPGGPPPGTPDLPDFDTTQVKTEPELGSGSCQSNGLNGGRQGFGTELSNDTLPSTDSSNLSSLTTSSDTNYPSTPLDIISTTTSGITSYTNSSLTNSLPIASNENNFPLSSIILPEPVISSLPCPTSAPATVSCNNGTNNNGSSTKTTSTSAPATPISTSTVTSTSGSNNSKKRKRRHAEWRNKSNEDLEIVLESSSSDSSPWTPQPEDEESKQRDDELVEIENEIKPIRKNSKKENKSPSSLLLDLTDNKQLVPPSVSITPLPNFNSVLGLERRPGIEIIPIVSTPPASLPSSITITPIESKSTSSEERKSKSRNEEKTRIEKKRKRKREDSPSGGAGMGPPEKLPHKQDPLSKPVSVSIKATSSDGQLSSSPKSSSKQSPKHSPGQSGGSGKPSMSALKSATNNSPGKEGSHKPKVSSSSNKDKDRKSFGSSSPKLKSSSVKLKQLDISTSNDLQTGGATPPRSSSDSNKGLISSQVRNRKGSLSAVIDKLKSQQVGPEESGRGGNPLSTNPTKLGPDAKNPGEYMVKPSSDGMKLTINKTRSKESKSSGFKSSSSGSGSPKTHTGLKPGVNSGPASKKPHQVSQQKNTMNSSKTGNGGIPSSKSSSRSSSSPIPGALKPVKSSSGSPKLSETNRRDKSSRQPNKGEKSLFGKSQDMRKVSPLGLREDGEGDRFKLHSGKMEPSMVVEGLTKTLDTKFQIPKLSQRINAADADQKKSVSPANLDCKSESLKYSSSNKEEQKSNKTSHISILSDSSTPADPVPVSESISKSESEESNSHLGSHKQPSDEIKVPPVVTKVPPLSISSHSDSSDILIDFSSSNSLCSKVGPTSNAVAAAAVAAAAAATANTNSTSTPDLPGKLSSVPDRMLSGGVPSRRSTPPPPPPPPPAFPNSPSVSVHIVKSPAPSPLVIPSPHSGSPPCITDDELMDEALVGIGSHDITIINQNLTTVPEIGDDLLCTFG